MKMLFAKVGSTPKPFALVHQGIHFEGTIQKSGHHRATLEAALQGQLDLMCDRCGGHYKYEVAQDLSLLISDRVIEDKDDLDIIEFLDGVIDVTYIAQSEINAIESIFHYCKECENAQDEIEIEF